MRKERKFKIEGYDKSFEVYELSVKEIIGLIEDDSVSDLSITALKELFTKLLPIGSNLSLEELLEMRPSEIEECWRKFREVNASFFEGIKKMGLTSMLNTVKEAIIKDFSEMLVNLSKQGTQES